MSIAQLTPILIVKTVTGMIIIVNHIIIIIILLMILMVRWCTEL